MINLTATVILIFLILTDASAALVLNPKNSSDESFLSNLSKDEKYAYTNYAVIGAVAVYGAVKWNYFENGLQASNEGWFGKNTKSGGADKLGHLYSSYLTSRMSNALYLEWGFDEKEAAQRAAITSFIMSTATEIGDASSTKYGFSYEDFVSNSVGQLAAYYLETNPEINSKVDLRLEYNPAGGVNSDIVTDYDSMKYLVAVKLAGFDRVTSRPLKYLEFHFGYYSRNFDNGRTDQSRNLYAGIGINLSEILDDLSYKKTGKIFNYYQAPYTYIEGRRSLD